MSIYISAPGAPPLRIQTLHHRRHAGPRRVPSVDTPEAELTYAEFLLLSDVSVSPWAQPLRRLDLVSSKTA